MPLFPDGATGLDGLINRPRPSPWKNFQRQPCVFLAHQLYHWRQYLLQPSSALPPTAPSHQPPVTIVCISDTHNSQPELPDGDVLIHAGDLTQSGTHAELRESLTWLARQPHAVKLVVAGNHDILLDAAQDASAAHKTVGAVTSPAALRASLPWECITYLENEVKTITCPNGRRLRVYGSPLSPRHGNWAFQYPRHDNVWGGMMDREGNDIDVLITHAPPRGHLDLKDLGCVFLTKALWRVRPRLHVFGHVHEGAGREDNLAFDGLQAAYERTAAAGGGIWNLFRTIAYFLWTIIELWLRPAGRPTGSTTLVNASMVGGLRDEKIREPAIVVI